VRLCVSFGDLHTPRYTLVLGLIVMCMWGGSEGARQRVAVVCLSYMSIYTINGQCPTCDVVLLHSQCEVRVGG